MKRILFTLAVAAIGGLASAQQSTLPVNADTGVSTTAAFSYTLTTSKDNVTLTLGSPDTSVLTYASNDGIAHTITAASTVWSGPASVTVFPTLSANGSSLRTSANAAPDSAPILTTAAADTSGTFNVALLAANGSGSGLRAGTYTATVTYTLN